MSLSSLSRIDQTVRDAVQQELSWDSRVDASAIGVTTHDGAVTLTGFIDSYAGKLAAERAAKRVRGVRAVANDIQVRLRLEHPDDELAAAVAHQLQAHTTLPEQIQAAVHNGQVTLTGRATSLFQRAIAERAVRDVKGVKHIINRIELASVASLRDVQREITKALHRNAEINGRAITVTVTGSKVHLEGTVNSWREREAAELAASHATGITVVDNRIAVRSDEPFTNDVDDVC